MNHRSRRIAALRMPALLAAAAALCVALPSQAQPRSSGLNTAYIDKDCKPCSDFFKHANGAWVDSATIPPAYTGIGAGREMFDKNQETLYLVLEKTSRNAAAEKDPTLKKLGFLYATLMDSTRANREGWQPISADLAEIDAIKNADDLRKQFVKMAKLGMPVPFIFTPEADPKQSTKNIAQLYQGGLGLPDRDYYFKTDPKSDTLRIEYVAHLSKMFQLVGGNEGGGLADAQRVMKLETSLAESCLTLVQQRDPNALYHKMTVRELGLLAPSMNWNAYFNEIGQPALANPDATIDVSMPGFIKRVSDLLATTAIEDWKAYLRAHQVRAAAPWLSQDFFDESFRFGSKISGARAPLPRWKRSAQLVDNAMGEALGKAYVEIAFPPSSKTRMLELVKNLQATFRERIQTRDWMGAVTKKQALRKLDAIINKIGYPDMWRDYTALQISGEASGIENLRNVQLFEANRQFTKVGKPVDRTEWFMSPPTVNAYYNPPVNEIVFPAGILQPPQFNPNADDAVNYGAIGMVIGHELTHGFDDQGRQYDAEGNLKDWWTADDAKNFKARADQVVQQYNAYVAIDTLHVNGELTLGENTADLGGITIAYYAYQKSLNGKAGQVIDGLTPEQRFFLGYAQSWRRKMRPEVERLRALTDPHSPAQYRVNGPLSNFPEFAKAFGCKAGDAMVRAEKISIW